MIDEKYQFPKAPFGKSFGIFPRNVRPLLGPH